MEIQIQVRNPWGNETEWKGTWADGGKEWGFIPDEVQAFYLQTYLRLSAFVGISLLLNK